MEYVSICSGIEAATMAWHGMGWKPLAFSEIEKFPSAVLAHHYPDVTNEGDFTKIGDKYDLTDGLLVGGTPCQSFSVAGLRGGMDDDRGNLALEFLKLARDSRAKWVVWENVPGVLSSNGGRDFGSILGGLEQLGYGWAYRVLDAQYFGVAQRRRRVFVVGCLGSWQCASAVLFERASLQGNPPPSREAGKGTAGYASSSIGGYKQGDVAGTSRGAGGDLGGGSETLVGGPDVPVLSSGQANAELSNNKAPSLTCLHESPIIMEPKLYENHPNDSRVTGPHDKCPECGEDDYENLMTAPTMGPNKGKEFDFAQNTLSSAHHHAVATASQVRRLTPIECERLQGFPRDFTRIPWRNKDADNCPDGPRYKALGNSMAVPVMKWIGERIEKVNLF